MTDLGKLEELAKAATPGPWEAGQGWVFTDPIYPDDRRLSDVLGMTFADLERAASETERGQANAEFIAAANPATVLALLAAHRAVLARIAKVEALHQPVGIEPSEDICGHCSLQLPNGNYFGKVEEWPCETLIALTEGENE